jgi:hypothetical protein
MDPGGPPAGTKVARQSAESPSAYCERREHDDRAGSVQREGEVVQLVAHQLTDLAAVGERDGDFSTPHERGDENQHGSPSIDPRRLPPKAREIYAPDLHTDSIEVKARDLDNP